MKAASKALKVEQKKINLSEIEDLQDDLEDMMEDMNEVSEVLGRSYGLPDGMDELDLDAELACLEDELESEDIESSAPAYLQPSSLPSQPHSLPSSSGGGVKNSAIAAPSAAVQLDEYGLPA